MGGQGGAFCRTSPAGTVALEASPRTDADEGISDERILTADASEICRMSAGLLSGPVSGGHVL